MTPRNTRQTTEQPALRSRLGQLVIYILPIILLLSGISLSWYASRQQEQATEASARARYEREVERTQFAIVSRLPVYENLLHSVAALSAAALFTPNPVINRDQWRFYVNALPIDQRYPGVLGIGYVVEVPANSVDKFETGLRSEGLSDYQVRPKGNRELYYPVKYIEPLERNQAALGLDLAAEPAQREAIEHARDTGLTTLTPKLTLAQGAAGEVGFLMIFPVYYRGLPINTVAQRRDALVGWVFAAIRPDEMMKGILGTSSAEVDLEIFDGTDISLGTLLYAAKLTKAPTLDYKPAYSSKPTISVNEHNWTLGFNTTPVFDATINRSQPVLILVGGVITSFLLCFLMLAILNTRSSALALAERMTIAMRQNEAKLQGQNEFLAALQAARLGVLQRQPLDELLRSIVERATEVAGTHHGYLFILEPDSEHMVMQVGVGFFQQRIGDRIQPAQSVAGVAWQNAQPLVVNDYARWPGRVPHPVFDQLRSLAGVPLKSGDKIVGVIGLGYLKNEPSRFSEDDIDRLMQIGEMVSLALDNAQLFNTAQQELAERERAEVELRKIRDELEMRVAERTAALQESEERYRTILESIQEGYYELDLGGHQTFFNDATARIIGYPREELLGLSYRNYVTPAQQDEVFKSFNTVFRTGEPDLGVEYQIVTKDGAARFIETSASLRRDADGNPIGFHGILRDITERKQAEEALRESEEKYRTILEEIDDGYFEVDLAGKSTFWNDAYRRLYGFAGGEMASRGYREYVDEEDSKKVYKAFNQVYRTGQPVAGLNYKVHRPDGTARYVESSASLRRDKNNTPIGFRGIIRDVTERKQAEEAIRRQNEYLAALQETTLGLIGRLDLNELLKDIVSRAGALVGTTHGYLYLLEPDGREMQMRVGTGVQTEFVGNRIKSGDGLAGQVWQSGERLVVNDYANWTGRLASGSYSVLRAVAGVPLKSGNQVRGVIGLAYIEEGQQFGETELETLNRFAQLASIALDNAQLFEKTQRLAQREQMITTITTRLHKATDVKSVMRIASEELRRATGSSRAVVRLQVEADGNNSRTVNKPLSEKV